MNVFIILSILIIVIGVLLLVATPSVLFTLNWNEKTGKENILMFMFYSILVYIINIIYWIIKWEKLKCLLKKQWKKCKSWLFKNIKITLETINLDPKQIKFLINIKNEKIDNKKENKADSNIKGRILYF